MIIAPSVLSLHFDNFKDEINKINSTADWIHFDVMDGNFVPNLSFGPDILKTIRKNSSLFLDVHLMVNDPGYYSDVFIKAGADGITFHYESYNDIRKCEKLIENIHSNYLKAGISLKPNTDLENIYPLLDKVDLVLVMSVEPGYGGQEFNENALERIIELDRFRKVNNLNYLIEVDGGVNDRNAYQLINAGIDIVVAGSYVFEGDIIQNIENLRKVKKSN